MHVRHGCRRPLIPLTRGAPWRVAAVVAGCAMLVGFASASFGQTSESTVSPWATGGTKAKAGDTDGKPTGDLRLAQVPVAQAQPLPGYVIQGGAIPKDWQPQAVPYQVVGPDGRPVTMYYAPTYTFTYPIGPPVIATSPVNRPQAYGQPAANGWNYRTSGAPQPAYSLPPPTVARYQPAPYQYPAGAQQLSGTPIVPPAGQYTPPPVYAPPPAAPPLQPYAPPPTFAQQPVQQPMSPPPSQWGPATDVAQAPQSNQAGQMLAAAAPPVMAGAAGAAMASSAPAAPPPTMVSVPQAIPQSGIPSGPMQPVSSSPQAFPGQPSQPQPPAGRSANSHLWRVVGVHDGDTITCLDENNQQQKIRMAEMDAPELGQDFGKVSRDAMASMVFGKTVEVVDDGKDRYGRWIGHIYVNGTDVNRQMIATGNAWHYAAYSKDKSLAALQTEAKAQKIGLWVQPNPTPPWEYRKNGKK